VIDCAGKVLMPGFVNTHTHVPMTLLRGLADDLRLDVWLMGYMMPVEREFVSPEFVRLGTKIACAELIRSGLPLSTICITLKMMSLRQLPKSVCGLLSVRRS
jgi:5-methylthioadenosine/S-adenosylhomocysteine deaminase